MTKVEAVSLDLAKRIAADVHTGLAPLEALPIRTAEQKAYVDFLSRLSPRYARHARLYQNQPKPHEPQGALVHVAFPPWPGETQVRAAYELAVERFLEYLENRGYVVLAQSPTGARLYTPKPLELDTAWQGFLEEYLGTENLQKTLGVLLNSARLAGRGFSAPKVPVVTEGVRRFLAAWYLANLLTVKERLATRERNIHNLRSRPALDPKEERKLKQLQELQQKEQDKYRSALKTALENLLQEVHKVHARRKKLKARLRKATPRNRPRIEADLEAASPPITPRTALLVHRALRRGWDAFQLLDQVLSSQPEPLRQEIVQLVWSFGPVAKGQLATAVGNKFAKVLTEFLRILDTPLSKNRIPPLVQIASERSSSNLGPKPAGDRGAFCYGCGRPLNGEGFKASKLIFSSPSQRLQSGTGQEEPLVCATCAALSLASPLKPGEGSALVRVDPKGPAGFDAAERARQFARLLVTGTLNIAAGRYIQLNSPLVGQGQKRRPLAQALGRVVYALAYLGQEVNPAVIRHMEFRLMEGSQEILLPRRALWLSRILQEAFGTRITENREANRDLGEAMRLVLADMPFHAEYVLAKRYRKVAQPYGLEESRAVYSHMLEEEGMSKLAEKYKDVAGLTGLLYAWASYVKQEVAKQGGNPKREIVKLLDNLESPNTVTYVAAYTLDTTQATLFKQPDTHFIYAEAQRLLTEAGVAPRFSESEHLLVAKDDLDKAYVYLMEKYGQNEKLWKNFIYEVRLALASRFPAYIRSEKED